MAYSIGCPFYCYGAEQLKKIKEHQINCEGVGGIGTYMRFKFADKKEKFNHIKSHCTEAKWKECEHAKLLLEQYDTK